MTGAAAHATLAAIAARWAATTPGPWRSDPSGVWTIHEDGLGGTIMRAWQDGDPADGIGRVGDPYPRGINNPTENMRAIAAAPEDIAWLLAEVRRLHGLLDLGGVA